LTPSQSLKLKLMTLWGWEVNRLFPAGGSAYWRANRGENEEVIEFNIDSLFESWLEVDSVMEEVLRVKTIRKQ